MKNFNEEGDEWYFLKIDFQYFEKLLELHNDWPFLSKRMNIEKEEKLVANLYDKTEYVVHVRNLKEALNHGSDLRKSFKKKWFSLIKMLD